MAKSSLTKVPISALQGELRRRARGVHALQRKREKLIRQVEEIDAEIREIGGTLGMAAPGRAAAGGRKRPRNDMNLVEALSALLKNKTMSVTEAAEAVQRAGYKTTSASFRTIVNQTLINSGQFKRVSRGQYTAK